LLLIVWPKIYRILSGEKVVMSSYLGAEVRKFSASNTAESPTNPGQSDNLSDSKEKLSVHGIEAPKGAGNDKEREGIVTNRHRISLSKDDPMPSSVATKIVGSESLLREVSDKLYGTLPFIGIFCHLYKSQLSFLFLIIRAATKVGLCYRKI
jgi:hypothetical protein